MRRRESSNEKKANTHTHKQSIASNEDVFETDYEILLDKCVQRFSLNEISHCFAQ